MQLEISLNHLDDPKAMRSFLAGFEQANNVKIDLQEYEWAEAWTELMKINLFGRGPVISEIGTTWMSSLTSNSLRPIKPNAVAALGGAGAFSQEAWKSCIEDDNETVLAIPWLLNTYLIYYRRDLLAKAGVDESSAFQTFENFIHTLGSLLKIGVAMPIALPTSGNSRQVFHMASSFVWQAGGEFITPDGKKVLFTDPRTLAGLKDYYNLHQFITQPGQNLYDEASIPVFVEGKAAVALRRPDLLYQIKHGDWSEEITKNTGVAMLPVVPFVGG
jgi:multiple sugar transport system substrate-binding protein